MKKFLVLLIIIILGLPIYVIFNFTILSIYTILVMLIFIINELLKRYIKVANKCLINFMNDSHRNYDAIIIGRPLKSENRSKIKEKNILSFIDRRRTLFASYIYLIHQYSYLREDGKGKVYIVISDKDVDNSCYVTITDIYSFHPVIKGKFNVRYSLKFPLLFFYKKYRCSDFFVNDIYISLEERIIRFCHERNLKLEIIKQ